MQTPAIYPHLMKGELNVLLAPNAMSATDYAADLVAVYNRDDQRVFCINTVYNIRVLNAMLRRRLGPDFPVDKRNKMFYFGTSRHGELGHDDDFLCRVGYDDYDVVIVTTWEFGARTYRQREALLHDLLELSDRGITVIVFSTATTEPHVGRADRGGIGKLSIVASNILSIEKQYRSYIGLTTAEIREAARQAWPEAYQAWEAEQEQKQRAQGAVEAAGRSGEDCPAATPTYASMPPESAQLSGKEINILPSPRAAWVSKEHPLHWLAMANNPGGGDLYHPHSVAAQFRYLIEDPSMNDPLPEGWEELYRENKWFRHLVDGSVGFEPLRKASEVAREARKRGISRNIRREGAKMAVH